MFGLGKVSVEKFVEACAIGRMSIVDRYLEGGGDVNARTKEGWSGFSNAVLMKQWAVADILVDSDLDLTSPCASSGETPLSYAAFHGRVELIEKLLAKGADPNLGRRSDSPELSGRTPLICACFGFQGGDVKGSIAALLRAGANPNGADQTGRTPLIHLSDLLKTRQAQSMFGSGPKVKGLAAISEFVSMISNVVEQSVRMAEGTLTSVDPEAIEVLRVLIDGGADVKHRDAKGVAAIDLAEQNGFRDVVAFLTANGAEAPREIALDNAGETDETDTRPEDMKAWRGLATEDVNEFAVLIRASLAETTAAFAKLTSAEAIEYDVNGKDLAIAKRGFVVFQLKGHSWTVIEAFSANENILADTAVQPSYAESLARELNTSAIYIAVSDTAYAVDYRLFNGQGELVEKYSYDDSSKNDGDDDETPFGRTNAFLVSQDSFLPGWGESARSVHAKPGTKAQVGFDSDRDTVVGLNYVAVKRV